MNIFSCLKFNVNHPHNYCCKHLTKCEGACCIDLQQTGASDLGYAYEHIVPVLTLRQPGNEVTPHTVTIQKQYIKVQAL